ncbi:MAG: BolA family transcriptional regulator, partial [Stenotrophomonas sp.]
MDAETIRNLIETGLPGARADVQGDDGVHFEATVVC